MRQFLWTSFTLVFLVVLCKTVESKSLVKREVYGDPHHDPHHGYKDKAKVEAKWGIKNALLGLVFNKINSFIDQKTAWIDHLDKNNIAKNKAHGIEPPKDPVHSLSGILSGVIGSKLHAAGPFISLVTSKLAGASSGGHGHGGHGEHDAGGHGSGGFNFGAALGGGGGGGHGLGGHAGVSAYGAI